MSRIASTWTLAVAATFGLALPACTYDPLEDIDVAAIRAVVGDIDEQRVWADIQAQVSAHTTDGGFPCQQTGIYVPNGNCALTHTAVRATIDERLVQAGLEPRRHRQDDPIFPTVNITADLRGVSSPDEVVVVAAHYDVFYAAANDNGSGVAAVLEAARVLSAYSFDRTIRFVFFDLEEVGLIGSQRFVDAWPSEETLTVALVLDMIGYAAHQAGSQQVPPGFSAPDVGDFLALFANGHSEDHATQAYALNRALDAVRLEAIIVPSSASPARLMLERSDHAPFWLAGLPAVFLTDTGDFRNPNYHEPSDTIDTIDERLLGGGTELTIAITAAWAGGPR